MRIRSWSTGLALLALGCADTHAPSAAPTAPPPSLSSGQAHGAPFIAASISAAELHTCALTPAGDVQCWGSNSKGQLGDGTAGGISETPVRVDVSRFAQVSVGGFHTCGLDASGAAYCWGDNSRGALGTGSTTSSSVPVAVLTELRFSSIDAGNQFTCALAEDGSAWCWGVNTSGTLGTTTTQRCQLTPTASQPCSTTPVAVTGGHVFTSLDAGLWNACGLERAGSAWCWGNNSYGQMGVGAVGPFSNPVPRPVSGGLTFASMSVGAIHVCALTTGGDPVCWGNNDYGQLGTGTTARALTPVAVQAGGRGFTTLAASPGNNIFAFSCGFDAAGAMSCWGANSAGQLGVASTSGSCGSWFVRPCSTTPVDVETSHGFAAVDLGVEYTCAISNTRRAYCWGNNSSGALGNPSVAVSTSTPTPVATWMKRGSSRRPSSVGGTTVLE